MTPWTAETNIINDLNRLVKFYFETSEGPGDVTALISKGVTIDAAKQEALNKLSKYYPEIECTKYEILEMYDED